MVCRAMRISTRVDNCGGCTVCLPTAPAEGKRGEMGGLQVFYNHCCCCCYLLFITEPPSAPLCPELNPNSAENIVLEWTEPEFVNVGGITSYNANCTEVGSQDPQRSIG